MTKSSIVSVSEKQKASFEKLSKEFGYKNAMAAPHLVKVTVSVSTGSSMKRDKKFNDLVMDRLVSNRTESYNQKSEDVCCFI